MQIQLLNNQHILVHYQMCISLMPTECKRLFLKMVGIYWPVKEILVPIALVSKKVSAMPKHMCRSCRGVRDKPMPCKPGVADSIPGFSIKTTFCWAFRCSCHKNTHTKHKHFLPSTGFYPRKSQNKSICAVPPEHSLLAYTKYWSKGLGFRSSIRPLAHCVIKWSHLFVVVFLREGDLSGIRIDEIIRNQQPMEQITIRKVEVSDIW